MTDISAADWVVEGVDSFGSGVKGLIPSGFESYARILHPAWRVNEEGSSARVPWATVAAETGRTMHSRVQFDALIGVAEGEERAYEPTVGEMPPSLLSALCEFLAQHTATPERCWFCLWEGWGWVGGAPAAAIISTAEGAEDPVVDMPPALPPEVINGPRVSIAGRNYILFEGPLPAATEMGWRVGEILDDIRPDAGVERNEFFPQTPSMMWPDDRSWCVATEIDLDSTYLGGSEEVVRGLLADSRFEAWRAELDDPIHSGGDDVNG